MIIDSRQIPRGQELACDVTIVGAGAAGITLARKLGGRGWSVVLLESGRFEYSAETQDLYRGPAAGPALEDDSAYLVSSRLRYFGGSTNHWGGFCIPLEPMDFETLPWVPHGGWPIGPEAIAPYYAEAAACVGVEPFGRRLSEEERRALLLPDSRRVRTAIFHLSPPLRFSQAYREEIAGSERIRLVLPADVLELRPRSDGGSLERLQVASLEGARFTVRARRTILAAGGIENARLLLVSDSVHSGGIGNGRDLVGRFFIEHLHRRVGDAIVTRPPGNPWLYRMWFGPSKNELGVLCLTEELRRRHELLNASVELVPDTKRPVAPGDLVDPEMRALALLDGLRRGPGEPAEVLTGHLFVRSEQAPNPESRVRLAEERDTHGVRRARLDWRLQPLDLETIVETARLIARELGRAAAGRVRITVDPEEPWEGTVGGNHHLGTTRMAATPERGVVDPDCRVFGLGDLYVAGSSVFPTGGFANPTFTLVALALRLADHLDRELSR